MEVCVRFTHGSHDIVDIALNWMVFEKLSYHYKLHETWSIYLVQSKLH